MKLVIATDKRYFLQSDGTPCCPDGTKGYNVWARYLDSFDSVTVVARLNRKVWPGGIPVEGDSVSVFPLDYYLGPEQYIKKRGIIRKQISAACQEKAAYLLRVPSTIASLMQSQLRKQQQPFGVEVIADPNTTFAPGACSHPLRSVFRWDSTRRLRQQCKQATSAIYVTDQALQASYPAGSNTHAVGCSDVEMPDDAFVDQPRGIDSFQKPANIIFVGTLAQLYKAPNVIIDAFSQCLKKAAYLSLTMIGDGKHQEELELQCRTLGIADQVHFLGRLPAGEKIREQLDKADLFILPSYQEGLPRAMVEAMGRALPCIGSTVGGIPELLKPRCMVPPGETEPLAAKIMEMLSNPERLARESKTNLDTANRYRVESLNSRRNSFFQQLRERTQAWQRKECA